MPGLLRLIAANDRDRNALLSSDVRAVSETRVIFIIFYSYTKILRV